MIDLESGCLEEIRAIVRKHAPGREVRAFGSRVEGTAEKYSDLDLAIMGDEPIGEDAMERLRDAFSESDLPILVDVCQWSGLPAFLRERIRNNSEVV